MAMVTDLKANRCGTSARSMGTEGMPGADLVGGERLELPTSSV